ncbi:hypothetical protein ABFS83_01G048900 [Erythranthe nasuta]
MAYALENNDVHSRGTYVKYTYIHTLHIIKPRRLIDYLIDTFFFLVHVLEWYEKHASRYLPSPFVMMENMQQLPSEILIIAFPDMNVGRQRMLHYKEDDMDPYAIMTIRRALFNISPF